jgi:YVTN family beta-propeller protein
MLHLSLFRRFSCFVALAITFLAACERNKDATPSGKYGNGVLIVNEGPFRNGTGSVSYYNRGSKAVENDIFQTVNNRPLGNIVQSLGVHNGKTYIVVNNANKVEVVNSNDFTSVAVISGLALPRYFLGISNQKAYISQWGADGLTGSVQVVDLNTNTVTKSIPTGQGPERMLLVNGNAYIICGGGFGSDSRITVINSNTDEVVTNITVGDRPNSIQLDANNKLWVSCGGKKAYKSDYSIDPARSTAGSLVRINPSGNAVELTIPFTDITRSPGEMTINKAKNTLFYIYAGKVYRQEVSSNTLNSTPVINRSFYELGIDPADDILYAADAGDYTSNGKVIRYNSSNVSAIDSLQVGIIPGGFAFR